MVIIVFGVTGAGKTTIGKRLAEQLGWQFYDADDFHPEANVEKMRQGIPLTDQDRTPWLDKLRETIVACLDKHENATLACSALKESYRQYLQVNDQVRLVYLKGSFELIQERLRLRKGHFMNPDLLRSQFQALELPASGVTAVDIAGKPDEIVQQIRQQFRI